MAHSYKDDVNCHLQAGLLSNKSFTSMNVLFQSITVRAPHKMQVKFP